MHTAPRRCTPFGVWCTRILYYYIAESLFAQIINLILWHFQRGSFTILYSHKYNIMCIWSEILYYTMVRFTIVVVRTTPSSATTTHSAINLHGSACVCIISNCCSNNPVLYFNTHRCRYNRFWVVVRTCVFFFENIHTAVGKILKSTVASSAVPFLLRPARIDFSNFHTPAIYE